MRVAKLTVIGSCIFAGILAGGVKSNAQKVETQTLASVQDASEMIRMAYDKFVFAVDPNSEDCPEDYFTIHALEKLKDDYEYDCEDGSCYAFYVLRTEEQDSKPGSKDESRICGIEPIENGWYVISYLDMGWRGITRVKVVEGKIDDYTRCDSAR